MTSEGDGKAGDPWAEMTANTRSDCRLDLLRIFLFRCRSGVNVYVGQILKFGKHIDRKCLREGCDVRLAKPRCAPKAAG